MIDYQHPDLALHPPRSPRVRLGGFAHLPRLIDKARAAAAGKLGLYKYACMLDRHFFDFTGIDAQKFLKATKTRKTDGEMLAWVLANMRPKRQPHEIIHWTLWYEALGPGSAEMHAWMGEKLKENGPARQDIKTYCDNLDLDDFVSFGGKG